MAVDNVAVLGSPEALHLKLNLTPRSAGISQRWSAMHIQAPAKAPGARAGHQVNRVPQALKLLAVQRHDSFGAAVVQGRDRDMGIGDEKNLQSTSA